VVVAGGQSPSGRRGVGGGGVTRELLRSYEVGNSAMTTWAASMSSMSRWKTRKTAITTRPECCIGIVPGKLMGWVP
jgi:hypothetical protein